MNNEKLNLEYVDIKAVLENLHIPYSTRGKNVSEGWIGTQCPFPGCNDKTNHLGLNLSSPVVFCFSCGKKGNYLTYLSAKLKSFSKAKNVLKKYLPRELKRPYNLRSKKEEEVFEVVLPKEATKEISPYHYQYIKSRNFDPIELTKFCDFHFCGPLGEWANRIIVPIYQGKVLVSFSSIDISKDPQIRYKHLAKEKSIIPVKNLLYGEQDVIGDVILVVEGFFDRARIGPGAVCTFGTKVTPEQRKRLINYRKVIIAFDGDYGGNTNGYQLACDISLFTDVELITLPDELDPDKLPESDILELKQMLRRKL